MRFELIIGSPKRVFSRERLRKDLNTHQRMLAYRFLVNLGESEPDPFKGKPFIYCKARRHSSNDDMITAMGFAMYNIHIINSKPTNI